LIATNEKFLQVFISFFNSI